MKRPFCNHVFLLRCAVLTRKHALLFLLYITYSIQQQQCSVAVLLALLGGGGVDAAALVIVRNARYLFLAALALATKK